jgi:hypothetical protein
MAFDGQAYSGNTSFSPFHITVAGNHAPVVTVPSANVAASAGQVFTMSSLFAATDADNNSLLYYLYDWSPAANSGHLVVNGNVVAAQTVIELTAAQLAQTTFVAGSGGTDSLGVMAFDGQAYSGNTSFSPFHVTVAGNHAPVVTVPSANVAASAGQVFTMSSLFAATDADNNSLLYYLYDWSPAANSGHLVVNGNVVAAQTVIELTAAQLAQTTFVAGSGGTTDDLGVMVFDGQAYSGNTSFDPFHVNVASPAGPASPNTSAIARDNFVFALDLGCKTATGFVQGGVADNPTFQVESTADYFNKLLGIGDVASIDGALPELAVDLLGLFGRHAAEHFIF